MRGSSLVVLFAEKRRGIKGCFRSGFGMGYAAINGLS
jgi:hypothetical protein